jgi:hypothetical protein
MKLNTKITRRFGELQKKADEILENQTSERIYDSIYRKVDPASVRGWGTSVLSLFQTVFGEDRAHYRNFHEVFSNRQFIEDTSQFELLLAVFQAAREDYEGGYLFDVRTLAKAEVMVDVLGQADIMKNAGYFDVACIMAGVALELAVKEICTRENIPPASFNRMNEELWKLGIYNQAKWEQLKTWYTRRSEPAHGNMGQSTPQETDEMIRGINGFIADYL